jgi:hypothetical protein
MLPRRHRWDIDVVSRPERRTRQRRRRIPAQAAVAGAPAHGTMNYGH